MYASQVNIGILEEEIDFDHIEEPDHLCNLSVRM